MTRLLEPLESKMQKLPYRVECRSSYPFFETTAAFDCEAPAVGYASQCALANADTRYEYRVMKGKRPVAEWVR